MLDGDGLSEGDRDLELLRSRARGRYALQALLRVQDPRRARRLVPGGTLLQASRRQPARFFARLHVHGVSQPDPIDPARKDGPGARSADRDRRSRSRAMQGHLHLQNGGSLLRARLPAALRAHHPALVRGDLGGRRSHARTPVEGMEARIPGLSRPRLRERKDGESGRQRDLPRSSGTLADPENTGGPARLGIPAAFRQEQRGRLLTAAAGLQCPICGNAVSIPVHRKVPDFEHGLGVLADFEACVSCGLVVQVPPPTAAALLTYYPPDYRPHAAAAGAAGGGSLLARLKDIQARLQIASLARFLPE